METPTSSPPTAAAAAAFVATLGEWAKPGNRGRAKIAQLKRNVGEPLPGRGVAWLYGELLRHEVAPFHHEKFFVVATVFDLNRFGLDPKMAGVRDKNLGFSMQLAVQNGADKDSTGRRLQILLDADFEEGATSELAFRLRQTVQWLAGRKVGVDYAQLLTDLMFWSLPDRKIQKKWARSFYDLRVFEAAPSTDSTK